MKTIKQDESISRSRFVDCPVCKNHTMKLKRTVQVGRCKTGARRTKSPVATSSQNESKPESTPESTLPSWQLPSDSSLFSTSAGNSSEFSDIGFEYSQPENTGESKPTSGQ